MASTPKKRPKSEHRNPNLSPSSRRIPLGPSPNFFPTKSEFLKLLAVVTIASSVALACNFIVNVLNRQPKPFSDSNGEFDDSLPDFCEPCPTNGVCHEGKLECASGYRKLGKSCVEDGDINELAKKLSRLVQDHVCEAYAQYLCDATGKIWVHLDSLWDNFDEFMLMEHHGSETSIYIHAKQRAEQTVGELLETRVNSKGIKELKCPELLVNRYKPVSCYIRHWIAEHAVRRWHYLSVRAEELYNKVCDCDILEENGLMSRSGNCEGEPWVVVSWLRDHLLSPRERRNPLL